MGCTCTSRVFNASNIIIIVIVITIIIIVIIIIITIIIIFILSVALLAQCQVHVLHFCQKCVCTDSDSDVVEAPPLLLADGNDSDPDVIDPGTLLLGAGASRRRRGPRLLEPVLAGRVTAWLIQGPALRTVGAGGPGQLPGPDEARSILGLCSVAWAFEAARLDDVSAQARLPMARGAPDHHGRMCGTSLILCGSSIR